jgi:DNA-binding XRE family transcriptional regulator
MKNFEEFEGYQPDPEEAEYSEFMRSMSDDEREKMMKDQADQQPVAFEKAMPYIYDWELIKKIRVELNMTQTECAKLAGMTSRQWQRYENNENEPKISDLIHICKALAADPCDFFNMW